MARSRKPLERRIHELRDALLDAQFELRQSKSGSVVLIVAGVPGAGRTETVRELLEWTDQKQISTCAFAPPDRHERRYPPMWRYWQALPSKGRLAFFFDGWYGGFFRSASGSKRSRTRAGEAIRRLEKMLRADGIAVVKVYLHIDAKLQRRRLKLLRADKLTRWRVTREDRLAAKHHRKFDARAKACIEATDHKAAPWVLVDGADEQERVLMVGNALLEGMRRAQQRTAPPKPAEPSGTRAQPLPARPPRKLQDAEYERELLEQQARFALLTRRAQFRKRSLVLAFEGMDAAGKGGAIHRLTHALDVRQYQVLPVSAPTPEELAHPYLWRFWRHVPERGSIAIFDRSWYGRVLVERVRGFARPADWRRAYDEINEFELELSEHGAIVQKFWLSVSKREQLARFRKRDENPLKRFKVDPEDWKNHRFYDDYQVAAKEMIDRTNTPHAPWVVIESDDKRCGRIKILQQTCELIERELG
jgi:polyphosphate:AMP phosphotransferase